MTANELDFGRFAKFDKFEGMLQEFYARHTGAVCVVGNRAGLSEKRKRVRFLRGVFWGVGFCCCAEQAGRLLDAIKNGPCGPFFWRVCLGRLGAGNLP